MPELCSQCSANRKVTYILPRMALELEHGHSHSFPCDGCNNRALYKDEEGRLWLAKSINMAGDFEWHPVNLDEL